jgi:hypothetical protein
MLFLIIHPALIFLFVINICNRHATAKKAHFGSILKENGVYQPVHFDALSFHNSVAASRRVSLASAFIYNKGRSNEIFGVDYITRIVEPPCIDGGMQ